MFLSLDDGSEQILFELPVGYLETMLSVDDRLKLYEYVLQKSKSEQKTHAVTYDELEQEASEQLKVLEMREKEDSDRPKSKVEAMAELRDYKRRRQSYRAKTISQSKRPAVEVIRELIDQQMKYLEIISGKNPDVGEEGDKEGEQNFESLRDSMATIAGDMEEESSRDRIEEKLSEKYQFDLSTRDRSTNRYGMSEAADWRRQNRSSEGRYVRRDNVNRDDSDLYKERDRKRYRDRDRDRERDRDRDRERGHDRDRERDRDREYGRERGRDSYRERQSQRDGSRDLGKNRDRNKDRRSRSKERKSIRVNDDGITDRKDDIDRLSHESIGNGRDGELSTRTETVGDSQALGFDRTEKNEGEILSERRTNKCEEQVLNRKISRSASEAESAVEERLKAIRTGNDEADWASQQEDLANEDEEVNEELDDSGGRRRNKKRSRSSSGSINGSTSVNKERLKNKKHKHKKKKKKSKKRKEDDNDKSEDEWVEKNELDVSV